MRLVRTCRDRRSVIAVRWSAQAAIGKFLRAQRLAKENGLANLELSVTYNWAWTTYFWFDDSKGLSKLYDEVELLALGSSVASEIELLTNLWSALRKSVVTGSLSPS